MSDIRTLDGKEFKQEPDKLEPVDELIEVMEGLLKQAKSGELRNMTYVGSYGEDLCQGIIGAFDTTNPHVLGSILEVQREAFRDTFIYGFSLEDKDEQ